MIFWASYDYLYLPTIMKWGRLSAQERQLNTVTLQNFRFLAVYAFHCFCGVAVLTPLALFGHGCGASGDCISLRPVRLLANLACWANPIYPSIRVICSPVCWAWPPWRLVLAECSASIAFAAPCLLVGLIALMLFTYLRTAKELYDQQWTARGARE